MSMKRLASRKNFIAFAVTAAMTGVSATAFAGAFQLFEQNAVDVGLAGAGGAAIANDASTAYFNPAGMTRLDSPEVVLSGVDILTNIRYTGTNTWSSSSSLFAGQTYQQSGTVQAGGPNFVPSFHMVVPIARYHMAVGFSVAAPYGLQTAYPWDSFVRYSATKTSLEDIAFSPSVAFQLNKHLSVGVGFDPQYVKAAFDSVGGLPPAGAFLYNNPSIFDTRSENQGNGWGYGWHAGVLWQCDPHTRFGFAYRSSTKVTLNGKSTFTGPLAAGVLDALVNPDPTAQLVSNSLNTRIELPATMSLSAYHDLTSRWAIMGTVTNTLWHVLKNITLNNVASVDADGNPTQSLTVNSVLNYHDSWRFSAGTQYQLTDKILVRTGLAYDETPTSLNGRSIRLPDERRIILGVGAHYQATKKVGVDVGWNHLFIKNSVVNDTNTAGSQITQDVGVAKSSADIVGIQLTVKLA